MAETNSEWCETLREGRQFWAASFVPLRYLVALAVGQGIM